MSIDLHCKNNFYYEKYKRFISLLKERNMLIGVPGIGEKHHIIPKSCGGSNTKSNLIKITYREHFICHWMLYKAEINKSLTYAFYMMCNKNIKIKEKESVYTRYFNSKMYQKLKESANKNISKMHKGKVSCYCVKTHKKVTITSQESVDNPDLYMFHTKGMVSCFDSELGQSVYITSAEYRQNKDRYKINKKLPEEKKTIYIVDNIEVKIPARTAKELRSKGCDVKVKYNIGKKFKSKIIAFDKKTNTHVSISKEEYYKDITRYNTTTKGMVLALNTDTNKYELVSSEEYKSGNYVGQTKGMVLAFDTYTSKYLQITKEEFKSNKNRYKGPMHEKCAVVCKKTGIRITLKNEEYSEEDYCYIGNSSLLFKCVDITKFKEKNINIFEWLKNDNVRSSYIILDYSKFKLILSKLS